MPRIVLASGSPVQIDTGKRRESSRRLALPPSYPRRCSAARHAATCLHRLRQVLEDASCGIGCNGCRCQGSWQK